MLSLVGDVQAVVEEVALGEPAIVGHSLGATFAAVYAAAHGVPAVVCVAYSDSPTASRASARSS